MVLTGLVYIVGTLPGAMSRELLALWFARPLEIPTTPVSLLWALPISLSIAVVYKALKLPEFRTRLFLREVALLFATIVGFLALVAAGLAVIAYVITW